MRIKLRSDGHTFWILLPTRLIFSKTIVKLALRMARRSLAQHEGDANPSLPTPDDSILRLCSEIVRVKRRSGSWVLVDVHSADGDEVKIIV